MKIGYFETLISMSESELFKVLQINFPLVCRGTAETAFSFQQGVKIGQREGLSELDLEKVGLIYSVECVERNREYLLKTCPSVVKVDIKPANISQKSIEDYFRERLWPFGIVPFKFRDDMEFCK